MRAKDQRRLAVAGALALAGVGVAAFQVLRDPDRGGAALAGSTATARREPPPEFVPAASASATKEAIAAEPADEAAANPSGSVALVRATPLVHLHGRLVGIVASSPWKAPVFLVPRFEAVDPSRAASSKIAFLTLGAGRKSGAAVGAGASPRGADPVPPDVFLRWDPVTEPNPTIEQFSFGDRGGEADRPPSSEVAADGTFDIVVGRDELVAWGLRSGASARGIVRATGLDLFANDVGYMPVHRSVELAQLTPDEDEDFEWTLEVVPAGRVTGLVDAIDRGPRATQAGLGAMAALFEGTLDGNVGSPVDVGRASDRYLLRAPKGGTYTLVLAADDFEPIQFLVDVVVGVEREQPTVSFTRGASIRGTVKWPPFERGTGMFLRAGATVTALAETGGGKAVDLPGQPLLYANGKLERRSRTVPATTSYRANAPFFIDGLCEGHAYRVFIGDVALAEAGGPIARLPLVTAPAQDVELEFDLAYLAVTVTSGHQPVPSAHITVSSLGPESGSPDRKGGGGYLLPPNHDGELLVTADGFETAREKFTTGPAGTVTRAVVDMVKKGVRARLDLGIECDAFTKVRFASLRFEPPTAATARAAFSRAALVTDGRAALDDLPEGVWRVRFEAVTGEVAGRERKPGQPPDHRLRGDLLDPDLVVELAADDVCTRSISLREGASLRLTCRDALGNGLAAECKLADAEGKPMPFVFVTGEQTVAWVPQREWSVVPLGARTFGGQTLSGATSTRTDPALPPGRYTLTLSHAGYETTAFPVELARGQIKVLDLVLPRTP